MKDLIAYRGTKRLLVLPLAGLSLLVYYVINFKIIYKFFPLPSLVNGVQTYEVGLVGLELVTFALFVSPSLFALSLLVAPLLSLPFRWVTSLLSNCSEKFFLLLLAVLAGGFTFCVATFLFHQNSTILIRDEIGYLFQANNFALGHLYALSPPETLQQFFDSYHIVFDGLKVFGKYPFVHSAVLAVGILLGWVYLAPITVAMCTILLNYAIAKNIYGEKTARVSSLLCLTSPFFLGYSSTLIAEGTCLLFFSLFVLFFFKSVKTYRSIVYPLAAGISLGLGFNTKPATAFALSLPFICYGIYVLMRDRKQSFRSMALIVIWFAVMLGLFFTYNGLVTGDFSVMPFSQYAPDDRVGFGRDLGGAEKEWGPEPRGHSPLRGVKNSLYNVIILNSWLGWFYPLLIPLIFIYFIYGKAREWDWMFVGTIVSLVGFYFFYWFEGVSFMGPLYYFSALLPLTLLSARALNYLFRRLTKSTESACIIFLLLTYCFLAGVVYFDSFKFSSRATKTTGHLYEHIKENNIHHALIFIEYKAVPQFLGYKGYTPRLLSYPNHPTFMADNVFAQDFGKENTIAMSAYSDRVYYIYDELTGNLREITKDHYRIE